MGRNGRGSTKILMRFSHRFYYMLPLFLWVQTILASDGLVLSPKGVNLEVAALMAMKREFEDSLGVMNGWDINSVDPCTWNMVGCSDEGFVISLEMASMGLSGILSPSAGNLSHLRTMLLQNNRITGSIPEELGKLSELEMLDLSGNWFDGSIPSSLGFLARLSHLRLNKNRLTGQIPDAVANLSGLLFLDLSYNNLTGPIPNILAHDYSLIGNEILCSSLPQICGGNSKPKNEALPPRKHIDHHLLVLSVAGGISCASVIMLLVLYCWVRWYRKRVLHSSHVQQDYGVVISHLKRFSFRELQHATDNFSRRNILGRGGYGVVYKGILPDKKLVAVKRLRDPNYTGEMQFQTEVEIIGLALHRNLIKLYGFCMTPEERLLVYPYMPNGSVADRLRETFNGRSCLDWNRRICIALGAARGLLYLHEQCNPKIIHRDVKAANILLDECFEAVVGDFGLAKLLERTESHVTTAVRGTVGYIAPEYLSTGQSSEKSDVFGFGILLLELVTGQKSMETGNGQVQKGMFLEWIRSLYEEKRWEELVDSNLMGSYNASELEKVAELSLLCTKPLPSLRPTMSEVLKVLEVLVDQSAEQCQIDYPPASGTFSRRYSGAQEESSFIMEAMELSGPR